MKVACVLVLYEEELVFFVLGTLLRVSLRVGLKTTGLLLRTSQIMAVRNQWEAV